MIINCNSSYSITPFNKGDAQELTKKFNNPNIRKWLLDLPTPYLIENANEWINDNLKYADKNYQHLNLVIRNHQNLLIGGIGKNLTNGTNFAHSCEIGFWLDEPYWNKGIMTLVVKKYVQYLVTKEQFVRVTAIPFKNNLGSAKVLDKCGFKLEGILNKFAAKNKAYHDCLLYAYVK
ncbi:MAG: GNAT family N-acetyltransferase [Bacteroidia bacterium]